MKIHLFLFLSIQLFIFNQSTAQTLSFNFNDVLTEYQLKYTNKPVDTVACKKYYTLALKHIENDRIWMYTVVYDSLHKERCEGLLLTDYHIHEYMLWFESDSIDVIEEEYGYVDFPHEFYCYYIAANKYFYHKYGSDFFSRIKKENDSLKAINQGYRPAYFVKHKHIYNKMQRISKYKINNRSCYGYPNSVTARLSINADGSVKSILIYRPLERYHPINHILTDDDPFAIETKRIISKLGKISPAYLRGVPADNGEIELFFKYK